MNQQEHEKIIVKEIERINKNRQAMEYIFPRFFLFAFCYLLFALFGIHIHVDHQFSDYNKLKVEHEGWVDTTQKFK